MTNYAPTGRKVFGNGGKNAYSFTGGRGLFDLIRDNAKTTMGTNPSQSLHDTASITYSAGDLPEGYTVTNIYPDGSPNSGTMNLVDYDGYGLIDSRFRALGGGMPMVNGLCLVSRSTPSVAGSTDPSTMNAEFSVVEFMTDAPDFFVFWGNNGSGTFHVTLDDLRVGTALSGTPAAWNWSQVVIGSGAPYQFRKVQVRSYHGGPSEVAVPAGYHIAPTPTNDMTTMLFMGDSWGMQGINPIAYATCGIVLGDCLGIRNVVNLAYPGGGISTAAGGLPKGIDTIGPACKFNRPDFVVVQMTINDVDTYMGNLSVATDYASVTRQAYFAMADFLSNFRAASDVPMIIIGSRPSFYTSATLPASIAAMSEGYKEAVEIVDDPTIRYLDLLSRADYPFSHPSTANDANVITGDIDSILLTSNPAQHPNALGHRAFGQCMARMILDNTQDL